MKVNYYVLERIASCTLTKKQLCKELGFDMEQLDEIIKEYEISYHAPKWRKWTSKEDETIKNLRDAGKKNYYIAMVLDRSIDMVNQRIAKLGLSIDKNEWTREECEQLMFMRRQNIPYKDIAIILERTWTSCSKKHGELMRRKRAIKNEISKTFQR